MVRTALRPAAVLWDMDGTLVDTEPYWIAAERALVESFGNEWPDHHAHALIGSDLLEAAEYMREHGGVPLAPEEIVDRMIEAVVTELNRSITWRPGARELLAELAEAGVPCALVTMSWRRLAEPVVAALPMGTISVAVTGDAVERGKPHPDPYLLAAKRLGVDPADCVAIEDSPTGLRSARAAGCRVVAVPNVVPLDPAPDVTLVRSLRDLSLDDLEALFDEAPPRLPERTPIGRDDRREPGGTRRGRHDDRPAPGDWWRRPWTLIGVLAVVAALAVAAAALLDGGGEDEPPPLPPGAVPVDVWAPYWTLSDTLAETDVRFDEIRELSPFWYGARGARRIVADEHAPVELTERFLEAAADSRARLVPSIRDEMAAGEMAAMLANPVTRSRHVEAILEFADELDADGIDLDYEQFAFADGRETWASTRPHWVAFVEELAAALHADGRTLTISIPPVYDAEQTGASGYWVYDHGTIAEHADAIRIMGYDYSVSEPGPIAPLSWVEQAVAGVSAAVPEELHHKLVLGVPAYGTNWVVSTEGECPATADNRTTVNTRNVEQLAELRGGVPQYDGAADEWYFTYDLAVDDGIARCIQSRRVHWVDADGVESRVELARRAGWGGVALWALGYEDETTWITLLSSARAAIPAEPTSGQVSTD